MFKRFFGEYSERIYHKAQRKMSWIDKFLAIVIIFLYLAYTILFNKSKQIIFKIISFSILGLDIFLVLLWSKSLGKRMTKDKTRFWNKYRKKHVNLLVKMLKSPIYNLYNTNGIDWLIKSCNNKLSQYSNHDSFNATISSMSKIVLPYITVVFPILANNLPFKTNSILTIAIALLLISMFVFSIILIKFGNSFLFPEKQIIQQLIEDLEYLKYRLQMNKMQRKVFVQKKQNNPSKLRHVYKAKLPPKKLVKDSYGKVTQQKNTQLSYRPMHSVRFISNVSVEIEQE